MGTSNDSLEMQKYMDPDGYIGHWDERLGRLEFGDNGQRYGMYHFAQVLKGKHNSKSLRLVEMKVYQLRWADGEWVRHPDSNMWYGRSGTMSRDNFKPLIILSGYLSSQVKWLMFTDLIKRAGFFWNTKAIWSDTKKVPPIPDLAGPTEWGNFIRAFGVSSPWTLLLWPVLLFTDLFMLINVLSLLIRSKINWHKSLTDYSNTWLDIVQGLETMMTPFSLLSAGIFSLMSPHKALAGYYKGPNAPPMEREVEGLTRYYFGKGALK